MLFFVMGPHPFNNNAQKYTIFSLSLALIFLFYVFTIKGPWNTSQDLQHGLQHQQSSVLDTDKQDDIHFHSTTTAPSQPVKNYTVITVKEPTIFDEPFLLASILSQNTTIPNAITSPNGVYKLALETEGGLRLTQKSLTDTYRSLWWTSTNDGFSDVSHSVWLEEDGRLSVRLRELGSEEWKISWHSRMLDRCKNRSTEGPKSLTVSNAGELQIREGGDGEGNVLCEIHGAEEGSEVPQGRLAVVVAGLYRNNYDVCAGHVSDIVNSWPGTEVRFFVYTYYDATINETAFSIKNKITSCYGQHLASVQVDDYHSSLETLPSAEIPPQCTSGWNASRLLSQFGTVFRGGQLLYKHTLKTGHDYDYVLRLRPDTYLPASPPWKATEAGAGARLIIPHPRIDRAIHHYYYCASPQGDVVVGATDQVAYGPKQLMLTLFDLYLHFRNNLANGNEEVAYRDFSGCHVLSAGAEAKECPWKQVCSPECHTTYWLASRGVRWETDWDWGHYPCKKGWYVEGDPLFCDYEPP